jgi:6-phosphogluconolactonase
MEGRRQEVIVCATDVELYSRAVMAFIEAARESIDERDRFDVALSGGGTPLPLYGLLASVQFREKVRWERVRFFWSDERCVPPGDEESNYRGAALNLLEKIGADGGNVFRIEGELGEEAARAYEITLRRAFGLGPGEVPVFDLMLLGMGEDGHTASIFPGSPAVSEKERLAVAVHAEKRPSLRVTLTPPVIEAAREVIVLVRGSGKASALKAALEGPEDPLATPAALLRRAGARVRWFVDSEAASLLERAGAGHG